MIKDSGDRTKFETGAVRDMRVGKGRCDLLPLDIVASVLSEKETANKVIRYHPSTNIKSRGVLFFLKDLKYFTTPLQQAINIIKIVIYFYIIFLSILLELGRFFQIFHN
ncbi:MAG: hypothetical protein PUB67_01410 [Clostridiales bacterium]|nr:hypothetical protein [Clostridiales bacterium]